MNPRCQFYDLGMIEYGKAFDLQKKAVRQMLQEQLGNTVFMLEHPPVYTIGRAGGEHNVLVNQEQREQLGIAMFDVDRGGDVTYHGPGQLVGYPILHLSSWKNDVRQYVRMLEEVFIRLLAGLNIEAGRKEGMSGVWVGSEKICAIGVKANRDMKHQGFITSHGFAFNVAPDLSHFSYIVPCGITQYGVTSLRKLMGESTPSMQEFKSLFVQAFQDVFSVEASEPTDNIIAHLEATTL